MTDLLVYLKFGACVALALFDLLVAADLFISLIEWLYDREERAEDARP